MVAASHPSNANENAGARHETSDLKPQHIALFGLTLAALIVIVLLVSYALLLRFHAVQIRQQATPSPLSYSREPTPEPHLEVRPGQELRALRAEEDATLRSYDWVDREKGSVRIPIDRAIDILAARGLPARPEANAEKTEARKMQKERHDPAN